MIDTLLIIGNGFDLYCQLPTKIADYYEYKKNTQPVFNEFIRIYNLYQYEIDINQFDSEFIKFINKYISSILSDITVWDFYFLGVNKLESDTNWYNIEKQISDSLGLNDERHSFWNSVFDCFEDISLDDVSLNLNSDIFKKGTNLENITKLENIIHMIIKYIHCNPMKYMERCTFDNTKKPMLREILSDKHEFLLRQLKILEQNFRTYILEKLNDNPLYSLAQENASKKLLKLTKSKKANLMSFNYTPIYCRSLFNSIENVHGEVLQGREIIFGIDNTKCNPGESCYKFTKTYRKVAMYISTPTIDINQVLTKKIEHIVFFGHSLNEQDYSYFQTIFDYFGLYDNQGISLDFRYNIYDKDRQSVIETTTINNVIALLDGYGKTLDNKYKGRNLIHKLLNESRLSIKSI